MSIRLEPRRNNEFRYYKMDSAVNDEHSEMFVIGVFERSAFRMMMMMIMKPDP